MTDDAAYVRKNAVIVSIDVHPTDSALVLHYQVEAMILDDDGEPMMRQTKDYQKTIRLRGIEDEAVDLKLLSAEVARRCQEIAPSGRIGEIEHLLAYVRKRAQNPRLLQTSAVSACSADDIFEQKTPTSGEKAHLHSLTEYMELLYEDLPEKIRASNMILQLARNPENLDHLAQDETLLGALARVLREDWKKNMDLSTNITYIFFCFSSYSQFHSIISHFKVGALCVHMLEHEQKRAETWQEEVKANKQKEGSYRAMLRKQDQLLRVSVYLLLNLAEDLSTEVKMVRRDIVTALCGLLDAARNAKLLVLVATFLRKLSIFRENKEKMVTLDVLSRIGSHRLLAPDHGNMEVYESVLRLLHNLSFDPKLRDRAVQLALVPHVLSLADHPSLYLPAISVLYLLSSNAKCRSTLAYSDVLPKLVKSILADYDSSAEDVGESTVDSVNMVQRALLVNCTWSRKACHVVARVDGGGALRSLIGRCITSDDVLLAKVLRNIASQPDLPLKNQFLDYIGDIASVMCRDITPQESFIAHCLGILSALSIPDLDYVAVINEYNLLPFLQQRLNKSASDDVMLLEIVLLLATVAGDAGGAELIVEQKLSEQLLLLLRDKQDDDEIVCQIINVFFRLLRHPSLNETLIVNTKLSTYLTDLMHDKNPVIRTVIDQVIESVADVSVEWSQRIMEQRFRYHNAQWLDMVERGPSAAGVPRARMIGGDSLDDDTWDAGGEEEEKYLQAEDLLEDYVDDADRPPSRMSERVEEGSEDEITV